MGYTAFRISFVLLALAFVACTWKRPRPHLTLAWVIVSQLASWFAYTAPLKRSYGMAIGTDRAFNVGMAACVATGHSPFQHTQVRFQSPEPFWNAVVGALALSRPERAVSVYDALSPFVILIVGLALYCGLRASDDDEDAWERVLLVFAVFSLTSISSHRLAAPPFFTANFLLKPNHAAGLALVALVIGVRFRAGRRWLLMALLLGLLAWVFLLHWIYLSIGLVVGALLAPASERRWRPLLLALAGASAIAAPFVTHLLAVYHPLQSDPAAQHMWNDPGGLRFATPTVSTIDLGQLFVLGIVGIWLLKRRGTPRDRTVLGVILAAWCLWALSLPGALLGYAPEPDELHYFLRFGLGLSGGAALAFAARHLERVQRLRSGQGHLAVFALCLPLSFPAYWDPPAMDNYHNVNAQPVGRRIIQYAAWIREHTPRSSVFLAGQDAATWIPALAGRRVLLAEAGKLLPPDHLERQNVERVLLTSDAASMVLQAARRYGITHVAIDQPLLSKYGVRRFSELARAPVYRLLFVNAQACILAIDFDGVTEGLASAASGGRASSRALAGE